jgi:glycosyltransferase involved in cell wall biosynthesis
MRILHIYSGNFYGGVETLLVTFARSRRLCPAMEPHYALCFEGRLARDLQAAGAPVYQLGEARASRPASVWRTRRQLRELLKAKMFDAVICHSPWPHAIFAPVVRAAGIPLVFWLHDAAKGKDWTERWARRTPPDIAICNSEFTQGTLAYLYPRVRSLVIHTPVPLPTRIPPAGELEAARAAYRTPPEAVVIIQPSRMEEWKGHRLHLEALGLLRRIPDWVCWMVGKPQRPYEAAYYQALQEEARSLGIADRVHFVGWAPDLEVLLRAAQIHCQPNTGPEPLGLTFLEAMAAKLPVVTTAIGGAQEIVTGDCGILTPPGDARALAAAIEKLIHAPRLREALGSAGPARVKLLCDPEQQLIKLAEGLEPLVRERAAA